MAFKTFVQTPKPNTWVGPGLDKRIHQLTKDVQVEVARVAAVEITEDMRKNFLAKKSYNGEAWPPRKTNPDLIDTRELFDGYRFKFNGSTDIVCGTLKWYYWFHRFHGLLPVGPLPERWRTIINSIVPSVVARIGPLAFE